MCKFATNLDLLKFSLYRLYRLEGSLMIHFLIKNSKRKSNLKETKLESRDFRPYKNVINSSLRFSSRISLIILYTFFLLLPLRFDLLHFIYVLIKWFYILDILHV